ncbi:MAG: serine hydrolase domain-containing protein [Pseudomonadota bacterium]
MMLTTGTWANDDLRDLLASEVPDQRAAEIAVWRDGKLHTATHGMEGQEDHVFILASVSKIFLSVALLQLHERNVLDIDDPIAKWLPGETLAMVDGSENATIAQLLQMRSGLPEYLNGFFLTGWFAGLEQTKKPQGALTYAKGMSATAEPGTEFEYVNTNYVLAQLVLEAASGMTMAAYFQANIFEPVGMAQTTVTGFGSDADDLIEAYGDIDGQASFGPVSRYYTGQGFGDGGLSTRAADVIRFYEALFVDRSLLGDEAFARLVDASANGDYGMGIGVDDSDGQTVYGHDGGFVGFATHASYWADENIIVVALAGDGDFDAADLADQAIDALAD